jgi:hypothetical protein
MNVAQRRQLAALLAERVRDKADREDIVGEFTAARMLDQVNEEIEELDAAKPAIETSPPAGGRRIFVKG